MSDSPSANLFHERERGLESKDKHLYKGASNGELVFRCIYRRDDETLRVFKIWTDHNKQELEINNAWQKTTHAEIDWSDHLGGN